MTSRMLAVHDEIDPFTTKRELCFYSDDGRGNGHLIFKLTIVAGSPGHWDSWPVAFRQLVGHLTAGGADAFLGPDYR